MQLSQIRAAAAKHIHLATEKKHYGTDTVGEKKEHRPCTCQGKSSAVQPMLRPCRKRRPSYVVQAKKCIPTPTPKKMIKLGQNRAKNQPQGRPVEVQKRALGGEASVNQPEKKNRGPTQAARPSQERNSATALRSEWSLQRTPGGAAAQPGRSRVGEQPPKLAGAGQSPH